MAGEHQPDRLLNFIYLDVTAPTAQVNPALQRLCVNYGRKIRMTLFTILTVFLATNLDTLVFLLLLLPKTRFIDAVWGLIWANELLWGVGSTIGKTLVTFFPKWITGILGLILIALAFKKEEPTQLGTISRKKIFFTCLSLGGDNLALFIPWASQMPENALFKVAVVFAMASLTLVWLGQQFIHLRWTAQFFERYVNYGTKAVYLIAGGYVVWKSGLGHYLLGQL